MRVVPSPTVFGAIKSMSPEPHTRAGGAVTNLFDAATGPHEGRIWAAAECWSLNHDALRGIYVAPYPKLLIALHGSCLHYLVDLRPRSDTYGGYDWISTEAEWTSQVFIPAYCGHAAIGLTAQSEILVLRGASPQVAAERVIRWDSPAFTLAGAVSEPIVAPEDAFAESLLQIPQPPTPWWKALIARIRSIRPVPVNEARQDSIREGVKPTRIGA